ncbi:MAG: ATP-binding protein [Melioribacteraceae bacterium]
MIKLYSNLSIVSKTRFLIITILGIILIISFTTIGILQYKIFKERLIERVVSAAEIVELNSIIPIEFGNKNEAQKILQSISTIKEVVYAVIYDKNNNLFSYFKREGALIDSVDIDLPLGALFRGNNLNVSSLIKYENEYYGKIVVVASTSSINESMLEYFYYSLSIFVFVYILSFLIGHRLTLLITAPLTELAKVVSKISNSGNYALRVKKVYNDEIGELYDNFNNMLNQIHIRDNKLNDFNLELENQVLTRTKELIEVNNILESTKGELEIKVLERTADLNNSIQKLEKSQKAMLLMVEDLNRTTKSLELGKNKLNEANKELEAFAYSVSHDLRAPLRGILGFTQILIEDHKDKLDEEGKRICSVILGNTERMGHLIDDLLSFSRLGRREIEKTEIDMKSMIRSIFYEISDEGNRNNIELNIGEMPQIFADSSLMKQVLINLLSNALKFSSKKEIIKLNIKYKLEDNFQVFSIQDNGAGFNSKYTDKLFGVFQRLHNESEFPGTGVGLAIVQRIIFRHGGKVWAEGEIDKGATFYFSLPI